MKTPSNSNNGYQKKNCQLTNGFWMLNRGNGHTFETYLKSYGNKIEEAGGKFFYIAALSGSLEERKRQYKKIVESNGGIDLTCGGFGVNGHIGFNDPRTKGTDLKNDDFVVLVAIDEICRQQQFDDYKNLPKGDPRRYDSINEVPTHAITITVAGIMSAKTRNYFIVPDTQKAQAVKNALEGQINVSECPASAVRLPEYQNKTRIFIDRASAVKLNERSKHILAPRVYACRDRKEIGQIAGKQMFQDAKEIIEEQGKVVINFAAAPSVTEVYKIFFALMEKEKLLGKIIGVHFDEMLGYKNT